MSLSNCEVQEAGFIKIAESLKITNLIHLDISLNVIAANLAKLEALGFDTKSQFKHLNLLNCDWQKNSLQILLHSTVNVSSLKSINISGCIMDDTDAQLLAASIIANDTLEQLVLAECACVTVSRISKCF